MKVLYIYIITKCRTKKEAWYFCSVYRLPNLWILNEEMGSEYLYLFVYMHLIKVQIYSQSLHYRTLTWHRL